MDCAFPLHSWQLGKAKLKNCAKQVLSQNEQSLTHFEQLKKRKGDSQNVSQLH